jgi:hypothetical protein
MNALTSRKKLLIAESELNRAQLVREWQSVAGEVRALSGRAKTISFLAGAGAALLAGLASFRRKQSAPAAEKPSWLQTVLKGAQLAGALWSEFRPPPRGQKDE